MVRSSSSLQSTDLFVALESRDEGKVYAEKRLKVPASDWQKLKFNLKPDTADKTGRFVLKLKRPGSVTVGYAFLQPGTWGRFQGLPVRKDVAEGLIDQGITVLRHGGCIVNAAEYRWKKMIGPREHRSPYTGWLYPHSSNGWGIFDFLNFCEAARFLAIPDVNIDETPQDMADFIEYANGPADSEWGRKRTADGHPKPYRLKHLQIGNEERVNEDYWRKFKTIAEAVWAKDPEIILVVGDFAYEQPITDPFDFKGAAWGITSLAAHQKILQLAKAHNCEVWFDVHIGTDSPRPDFGGTWSYIDALEQLADGARHRVVVFAEQPLRAKIQTRGFVSSNGVAKVEELSGPLHAVNMAVAPGRIKPYAFAWPHESRDGQCTYTFPPHSFTTIRFD